MAHTAYLDKRFVFKGMPFCGVLLDLRDFSVYRLSRVASAALSDALGRSDEASAAVVNLTMEEKERVEDFLRDLEQRGIIYLADSADQPEA